MPPKTPPSQAAAIAGLNATVGHMQNDVVDIKRVLGDMSKHLGGIARIEERQTNVITALERSETAFAEQGKRLSALELKAPMWDEMRDEVKRGVRAGVYMLAAGVVALSFTSVSDRFFPKPQIQYLTAPPAVTAQ